MTIINTVDQLFNAVEYSPMQLDLNKHVFRYYKQLENYPNFFSIYQHDYIDDQLVTLETMRSLSTSKVFQDSQFSQGILTAQSAFKLNILNAFKLYVLLQEQVKSKVNLDLALLSAYERLDYFFQALNHPPNDEDLRVNKRELDQSLEWQQAHHRPSILPVILLVLIIIVALILMIFTSGIVSLIFQACLYGFSFLVAKSMISESQHSGGEERDAQNNLYVLQLDYFFEKNHLNLHKTNPQ